jgi:hypothetical protein
MKEQRFKFIIRTKADKTHVAGFDSATEAIIFLDKIRRDKYEMKEAF